MSDLQKHLADIRANWDRHDHWFDALCNNLVRGHMKELEELASLSGVGELVEAAEKLLAALDELTKTTIAERIITGRSDQDVRRSSNEAIAQIRTAVARYREGQPLPAPPEQSDKKGDLG